MACMSKLTRQYGPNPVTSVASVRAIPRGGTLETGAVVFIAGVFERLAEGEVVSRSELLSAGLKLDTYYRGFPMMRWQLEPAVDLLVLIAVRDLSLDERARAFCRECASLVRGFGPGVER